MIDKFKYSREHIKDTNIFMLKVNDNTEYINRNIIPDNQLLDIEQYKLEHDRNQRLLARRFLYVYLKIGHCCRLIKCKILIYLYLFRTGLSLCVYFSKNAHIATV